MKKAKPQSPKVVPPFDAPAFREFERSGWERAAAHYDTAFGAVTKQAGGALLDAVKLLAGMQLLDVATGPG